MDAPHAVDRLRILFLTPQIPYPPRQGTSIRNYNLIRYVALRHVVELASFLAPGEALSESNPLHDVCRRIQVVPQPTRATRDRVFDTFTSAKPDMGLRLHSNAMLAIVDQVQPDEFDIVQVEGIEMAPYAIRLAQRFAALDRRPAIVFDDHNCEYLLQKRNALTDLRIPKRWLAAGYSLVQWRKLRAYERLACQSADLVVAVSEPDRAALQQLTGLRDILLAPNGVDTQAYAERTTYTAATQNIVFTGKMDYRPNIDAALWFGMKVFPSIQAQLPHTRFQIVGQQPHARLNPLRLNPGVEITGEAPDITPYLDNAAVFIIPMRIGGGTRLKALEAMAAGLPIVSTTLGVEGIPVRNGVEMLIRDEPAEFADAVISLIHDVRSGGETGSELGRHARQFVAARYDWNNIVPILEQGYQRLVSQQHRKPNVQ